MRAPHEEEYGGSLDAPTTPLATTLGHGCPTSPPTSPPIKEGMRNCSPELRRPEGATAADVEMQITPTNGFASKKTAGDKHGALHSLRRGFFRVYGCFIVSSSFLVSVSLVNCTKWVYV